MLHRCTLAWMCHSACVSCRHDLAAVQQQLKQRLASATPAPPVPLLPSQVPSPTDPPAAQPRAAVGNAVGIAERLLYERPHALPPVEGALSAEAAARDGSGVNLHEVLRKESPLLTEFNALSLPTNANATDVRLPATPEVVYRAWDSKSAMAASPAAVPAALSNVCGGQGAVRSGWRAWLPLHPQSTFRSSWDLLMAALIIYITIVISPLRPCLSPSSPFHTHTHSSSPGTHPSIAFHDQSRRFGRLNTSVLPSLQSILLSTHSSVVRGQIIVPTTAEPFGPFRIAFDVPADQTLQHI